jgi:hypothetical protein
MHALRDLPLGVSICPLVHLLCWIGQLAPSFAGATTHNIDNLSENGVSKFQDNALPCHPVLGKRTWFSAFCILHIALGNVDRIG